jgi:hypothetical protein
MFSSSDDKPQTARQDRRAAAALRDRLVALIWQQLRQLVAVQSRAAARQAKLAEKALLGDDSAAAAAASPQRTMSSGAVEAEAAAESKMEAKSEAQEIKEAIAAAAAAGAGAEGEEKEAEAEEEAVPSTLRTAPTAWFAAEFAKSEFNLAAADLLAFRAAPQQAAAYAAQFMWVLSRCVSLDASAASGSSLAARLAGDRGWMTFLLATAKLQRPPAEAGAVYVADPSPTLLQLVSFHCSPIIPSKNTHSSSAVLIVRCGRCCRRCCRCPRPRSRPIAPPRWSSSC